MKKRILLYLTVLTFCITASACSSSGQQESSKESNGTDAPSSKKVTVRDLSDATPDEAWEYAEEIISVIHEKVPVFGSYQVSIADFGAVSQDGEITKDVERTLAIDNTKAIYKAICDVNAKKDGGTVIVPAGIWYTAAIHLKSNVNLHLEEGATLRFATDTDLYAGDLMKELYGSELTLVRNGGIELYNYSPFIYANGADNIALTGKGTIDGQAKSNYWVSWRTLGEPTAANHLFNMAEQGVPVKERLFGEASSEAGVATDGYIRPNFVEFFDCDRVLIEDITTANTPAWQIHPVYCNYVTIRRLNINSLNPNSDGIDPDSCKYVLIDSNTFNTGDDCIAIKSGKNTDGRRVNIASENILIQNNIMQEGHGGVTLGSEASAGIRNVFARNNRMESLAEECIFRFKNSTLRGNTLENIFYKDNYVTAFNFNRDMIVFESDYGVEDETEYFSSQGITLKEYKPVTRNVYIDGFYATQQENIGSLAKNAIRMEGVESCPITNIHFSNISIDRPEQFMKLAYVDGLTLENVTITRNKNLDAFNNCKNFMFKNVSFVDTYRSSETDYSGIENYNGTNVTFTVK